MSLSLRSKVVMLVITLITLLTITLSFLIGLRSSTDFKNKVGISLSDTAYQMTSRLDQYMWGRAGEIRVLSETPIIKHQGQQVQSVRLLSKMKENYPAFSWIGVTDLDGIVLVATDGILVGQSLAKRPVYIEGIKGEFIGDVHDAVLLMNLLPNPSGEPMKFVDISLPIKDDDNKVIGVLVAHLSWSWATQLEQSMFQPLKDRNNEEIMVVSRIDNTVLLGPKNMIGQKLELESVKQAQIGEQGWKLEEWPDGKEYITGYASGKGYLDFKGLGWIVLVRQPVDVAYSIIYDLQLFIWIIGGIFLVLFAIMGWRITGSITKPLREFAKAADRIRFGGQVEIPRYKGIREVEILTDSMNDLVNSLSIAENELNKMEQIAHQDRLTGLPNRVGLENFVIKASKIVERQGNVIAVLYMDLDGFKTVNDTLGHLSGDFVLKEVARILQENIRAGEFVARLGGDEFIAILFVEEESKQEAVNHVATRIINEINKPIVVDGGNANIGCSIGCAFWVNKSDIKDVIDLADKALYEVKKSGKNKIKFAE